MKSLLLVVLVVLGSTVANAQEPAGMAAAWPGSAWAVVGSTSPIEPGNIILSKHAEQGIVLWRPTENSAFVPFTALNFNMDTDGNDWNRSIRSQIGVKFVRRFRHGIAEVGVAWGLEHRFQSGRTRGAPLDFADFWFGSSSAVQGKRFPTVIWGAVGQNVSPIELGNNIGSIHAEQGVVVARVRKVIIEPLVETTTTYDTQRRDWDRKTIFGAGVGLVYALQGNRSLELRSTYSREHRFISGRNGSELSLSLRLWAGWKTR